MLRICPYTNLNAENATAGLKNLFFQLTQHCRNVRNAAAGMWKNASQPDLSGHMEFPPAPEVLNSLPEPAPLAAADRAENALVQGACAF